MIRYGALIIAAMAFVSGCTVIGAVASAFPDDEPPGALLRPRPRPCAVPAGATFASVEQLDSGISPAGPVKGNWRIGFGRGTFKWSFSDMAISGRFVCDGVNIVGTSLSGTYSGTYDPETWQLHWQGHVYDVTGKYAKLALKQKLRRKQPVRPEPQPVRPEQQPVRHEQQPVRPEQQPRPVPVEPVDFEKMTRVDLLGKDDQERRGCVSQADCVVTCDVDGSCCGTMCGCSNALNRDFARRLGDWQSTRCGGRGQYCPAVACMMRGPFFPACNNGLCESYEMGALTSPMR